MAFSNQFYSLLYNDTDLRLKPSCSLPLIHNHGIVPTSSLRATHLAKWDAHDDPSRCCDTLPDRPILRLPHRPASTPTLSCWQATPFFKRAQRHLPPFRQAKTGVPESNSNSLPPSPLWPALAKPEQSSLALKRTTPHVEVGP